MNEHFCYANIPVGKIPLLEKPHYLNINKNILIGDLNQHKLAILDIQLINELGQTLNTKALIDTGSFYSFITNPFMLHIGASYDGGKIAINGFGGQDETYNTCQLQIGIPQITTDVSFKGPIGVREHVFRDFNVLIGTQFLWEWGFIFTYNKPSDKFTLEYR